MSVPCCLHEWLIMHGLVSIVYQAGVCVCKLLCNSIHCMLQPRPSSFQDQAGSFCTRYRQGLISPLFFFLGGVGISLFAWLILRYLTPKFTGSLHLLLTQLRMPLQCMRFVDIWRLAEKLINLIHIIHGTENFILKLGKFVYDDMFLTSKRKVFLFIYNVYVQCMHY